MVNFSLTSKRDILDLYLRIKASILESYKQKWDSLNMTYILGIKKDGFSTIISDLMVSFKNPSKNEIIKRENTSLKSGILFKGCIFGLAGNATLGLDFINKFKEIADPLNSSEQNWQLFQKYIKAFSSDYNREGFEMILSYRTKECPILFLFNSKNNSLSIINRDICTIGSGKIILDDIIENRRNIAENAILKHMHKEKIPIIYFPYFYCLCLSELTMGFEYSFLEKIGVGGLFHFCYQTNKFETRQKPAVYILIETIKNIKTICNYIYRVAFIDGFLVVDNPLAKPQRQIITSSFERPDIDSLDKNGIKKIGDFINKKTDEEKYYYFCGFGFKNPDKRGSFVCHISGPKGKLVVDKLGNIGKNYKKAIEEILAQ